MGSAMWFYMTAQSPKPSMHDAVMGRVPGGFAATINIINGGIECGRDTP